MSKDDPDDALEPDQEKDEFSLSPKEIFEKEVERHFRKAIEHAINKATEGSAKPKKLKIEQAAQVTALEIKSLALRYSSPIPPEIVTEGYERILPGAADRILTMAEKAQEANHTMDEEFVKFQNRSLGMTAETQKRGSNYAFSTVILGFVIGSVATLLGHKEFGIACIGGPLALVASIFIVDKFKKDPK